MYSNYYVHSLVAIMVEILVFIISTDVAIRHK